MFLYDVLVLFHVLVVYVTTNHSKDVSGGCQGTFTGLFPNSGIGRSSDCCGKIFYRQPVGLEVVASRLVQLGNLGVIVHSSHVPVMRDKFREENIHAKLCACLALCSKLQLWP